MDIEILCLDCEFYNQECKNCEYKYSNRHPHRMVEPNKDKSGSTSSEEYDFSWGYLP